MSMIILITQLVPTWREGDDYGRVPYDTFENKQLKSYENSYNYAREFRGTGSHRNLGAEK